MGNRWIWKRVRRERLCELRKAARKLAKRRRMYRGVRRWGGQLVYDVPQKGWFRYNAKTDRWERCDPPGKQVFVGPHLYTPEKVVEATIG